MSIKTVWKNSKLMHFINEAENFYFRKKLNNTNFTILCPNCTGGVIYNRLHERFNSPTVNVFITPKEFCTFVEHIHFYLNSTFSQIDAIEGAPAGILHGNGKEIPDITVRFVHYKTFDDGVQKWNERKARIVWDNLYIIAFDIEIKDKQYYQKLETLPCNNRILLTADKSCPISWSHYIHPHYKQPNALYYLDRDILGLRTFEKKFDFVSFLNKK